MGLAQVNFDVRTPADGDQLSANIAHALSLKLPEADDKPNRKVIIVANGPSARLFDIKARDHSVPTVSINGSLKLFTQIGEAPTYWMACDPQTLVADFLIEPPVMTRYLVASKCDPLVFEMLKGRDVALWHVDDHDATKGRRRVRVASSVTLCAFQLLRRMGFREFEVYGWDGCFGEDGSHHATEPARALPEGVISLTVGATQTGPDQYEGGRPFATTSTWACEAQDAVRLLQHRDYDVTIHGDGMIKAILETTGVLA